MKIVLAHCFRSGTVTLLYEMDLTLHSRGLHRLHRPKWQCRHAVQRALHISRHNAWTKHGCRSTDFVKVTSLLVCHAMTCRLCLSESCLHIPPQAVQNGGSSTSWDRYGMSLAASTLKAAHHNKACAAAGMPSGRSVCGGAKSSCGSGRWTAGTQNDRHGPSAKRSCSTRSPAYRPWW